MVQKFFTWFTLPKCPTILRKTKQNNNKKKTHKSYTPTSALDSHHFFFFFFTFVHAYKSSNGVNKTCKQYREKYKQERKYFEIVNAFRGYFNPTAQRSLYFPCAIFERGIFAGQSNIRSLCGHSVILSHRFNPETASIRRKPAFSLIFAARFSSSGWKGWEGKGEEVAGWRHQAFDVSVGARNLRLEFSKSLNLAPRLITLPFHLSTCFQLDRRKINEQSDHLMRICGLVLWFRRNGVSEKKKCRENFCVRIGCYGNEI